MNFIKQTKNEVIFLLKKKFIIVFAILILAFCLAVPFLTKYMEQILMTLVGGHVYTVEESTEAIVIDGVTIEPDTPFFYKLNDFVNNSSLNMDGLTPEEQRIYNEVIQVFTDFYLMAAENVKTHEDYRSSAVYSADSLLIETYILQSEAPSDQLANAISRINYIENLDVLVSMTPEEKTTQLDKSNALLEKLKNSITSDDFAAFVDSMIAIEETRIESLENQIETQEKAVVETPELEESADREIKRLNTEIEVIKTATIPMWEYRLEHNIRPNLGTWQNTAIYATESAKRNLLEEVMTEEEFNKDRFNTDMYGSYAEYKVGMDKKINKAQEELAVAEASLESGKPDMRFVEQGSRNQVHNSLFYSVIIAFFAILIGGHAIASEFQAGTIRLLTVRPSTRLKIYFSKFLAGLFISLVLFIIGMLISVIISGILYGFGDYAMPIYTATGTINFWLVLLGRMAACSVTIIFSYGVAFGLSAIIKNAALAIILPSIFGFGSSIITNMLSYSNIIKILPYTPFPYWNVPGTYEEYGVNMQLAERGLELNMTYGLSLLLAIALVFTVIGYICFKKKDITN